ncbi:hypothetical protein EGR_07414 [Echinococcus granulosus]|uniref:PDZ domain-containing protein n=1 Tax=Echinococcus granulosus TaxID=6210 RepID=W6UWA5_ECHGR|nr:hypothetical protein EGR_07414 [Echinococcus granulosus]EUB57754.1 hypothetical protein EGR_07414 [Echinococcus granulosus]
MVERSWGRRGFQDYRARAIKPDRRLFTGEEKDVYLKGYKKLPLTSRGTAKCQPMIGQICYQDGEEEKEEKKTVLLTEQRCDRSHVTRRRGHLKSRGRSLEIVDSQTAEGVDTDIAFVSHRIHRHHQQHQALEGGKGGTRGGDRGSYRNLSRSDSRLNRDRLDPEDEGEEDEEEGSISSSAAAAAAAADADISVSTCTSSSTSSRSIALSASRSSRSSSTSSGDLLETSKPTSGSHRTFAAPPLPSNGKQRSHRSTEVLPRGNPLPAESRNTTPIASRRRLHRSTSRENRLPSWRGWIRLVKPNPTDSFGIGLSKGLSSRGIYVSAIRPGSVAYTSGLLQIYDRILKVG